MNEQPQLRQFLLFVFALLIPAFALWTLASAALAQPVIGLANIILSTWFPDTVSALYVQGAEGLLMTQYGELDGRAVPQAQSEFQLGFIINTRILSYSIPFYAALHFATRRQNYLGSFLWGLAVLYPLMLLGLLCVCLKQLMVNLGTLFLEQPDVLVPNANVIGILYQFSVLIIPTLAPILIWAWQSRDTPLAREIQASFDSAAGSGEDQSR